MSAKGEDRETFMQRVREALEHEKTAPPAEPAPEVNERLTRLASDDDDLMELFATNAETVGMKVHQLSGSQLAETLHALCSDLQITTLGFAVSDAVQTQLDIQGVLSQLPVQVGDWHKAEDMTPQFDFDAGLTDVHAALAESGTLICAADAEHPRGMSLAPPNHLAIVRASDLLADMIDFWQHHPIAAQGLTTSSIAFITGPSKTADIEGELVTGVHGPGQVHVLLINDA